MKASKVLDYQDKVIMQDLEKPIIGSSKTTEAETIITLESVSMTASEYKNQLRASFESGAAWQREHHYTPNIQNSVEAHKEALARWPE
jgi:hypothetical protein